MRRTNRIRKSLTYSYIDGAFASIMLGLRDTFITPFAIALGATTGQVGLLTAAPNLLASLAQVKSADITEALKSRKKVISVSVFVQALMFFPIFLIPFLIKERQVEFLIFFYTIHLLFGNFAAAPWGSLIAKYIPSRKRGRYFGFRNKTLGLINTASAVLGGFLLHRFHRGNVFVGYGILFFIALFTRLASWHYLNKMYEPPFKIKEEEKFTFFEFVSKIKRSNFTRFVFYVAAMVFCVNISAPFFAVYMLKDLSMSYPVYTLITVAASITMLLVMDRWGSRADIFGNIKILKLCSFFRAVCAYVMAVFKQYGLSDNRPGLRGIFLVGF